MSASKPKRFNLNRNGTLDLRSFSQAAADAVPRSAFGEGKATLSGCPSPGEALKRLLAGHEHYVQGKTTPHNLAPQRAEPTKSQQPIAAILSCSDSRVVPDFLFDQPPGALFAVRIAGNFVTSDGLASLEYGVEVLQIPLVFVLGHSSCGAVDAAVKAVKEDAKLPGKIPELADAIVPAVEAALKQPGNLLDNAIAENVKRNVEILRRARPILGPAAESGNIKIVGGVYNIATGCIEMLA
jgi:carbonic anhydrase